MAPEIHSEVLEQVFEDLSAVARAAPPLGQFCEDLVVATLAVTGAHGAGVWVAEGGELRGVHHLHLDAILGDDEALRVHEHMMRLAISTARIQTAPIRRRNELAIACPLSDGEHPRGVLMLVLPDGSSNKRVTSVQETVAGLSELCTDYFYCVANRDLTRQVERLSSLEAYSLRLHQCKDRDALCFEVAAALPSIVGADRVLVLVRRRGRLRLVAVTGVDTIDARAETTLAAEDLAATVARAGEPLWDGLPQDKTTSALPPQLEAVLAQYSETCYPRALLVYPATSDSKEVAGAIIVEWSKHCPGEAAQQDALRAADHTQYALAKSERSRWLSWSSQKWLASRLAAMAALTALITWFLVQPVAFDLESRGTLQPEGRTHVFAPADGQVKRLFVGHGDLVSPGDRLFALRSLPLERDLAELEGKQRELETRLTVIELESLATPQTPQEQQAAQALAAEEKQLREELTGLKRSAAIVQQQIEELIVRSPCEGRVVSWDLRQDWADRQVRRGQPVLRIDDSAGPWELELKLPERRYGHLHRQLQQGDVPVQFRLASDPERRREGTVSDVGLRAEVSVDGQSYVPVIVDVPPAELPRSPRAGATVTARMSCGRRSRGFVWFHQVAEYIRQRLLL